MRTDLENTQDNPRRRTVPAQQGGGDAERQRRRAERERNAQAQQNRERKILIAGAALVFLVVILIFSAGKGWQSRTDKKLIENLNKSNTELQTQIQELKKENEDLQKTVTDLQAKAAEDTTAGQSGTVSGSSTHTLESTYNFRAEPSEDAEILTEIEEGSTVEIVKIGSDGWVQIKYNGTTGYAKCGDELSGTTMGSTAGTSSPEDSEEE